MKRVLDGLWQGRKMLLLVTPVAAGAFYMAQPRVQPRDQEQLQALVARVEEGFESQESATVMGCIARDYHDSAGLDHGDVLAFVGRLAREAESVEITITDSSFEVAGAMATGHFDVEAVVDVGGEVIQWPMKLEVEFEKRSQGARKLWRKAWVVTSCEGHGLTKTSDGLTL
jgi:hypothetical protein